MKAVEAQEEVSVTGKDIEARIHVLIAAEDYQTAATEAIELYGPELHGFIHAVVRHATDADEVFAQTCSDIWRGIRHFRAESSFRTWAYVVARNAHSRYRRSETARREKVLRLAASRRSSQVGVRPRSTTKPFLRTEVKERFASLRRRLSSNDQMLLVLRIDRDFAWEEVARVMYGLAADGSLAELRRHSATCRKRFERSVKRLRELAEQEGLIEAKAG